MAQEGSDGFRYPWQSTLQSAASELDQGQLKRRIDEAEAAIFQRLQELAQERGSSEERQALTDASNLLLSLKKEVLKFPGWEQDKGQSDSRSA
jgi:hypothetical protein